MGGAAAGDTGGVQVAGDPATGGVHVGVAGVGAGSAVFACTIFSRFSRTLKLKRRRFGFPRRPASSADGSGAAGSAAGGGPAKLGGPGGAAGMAGGTKVGGAAGPLVAGANAGGPNGEFTGGA